MSRILLVDAPGAFRDSVIAAVEARGAQAITRDDGMEALASIDSLEPDVILIGSDPGPPGPVSLSRILARSREGARVYRLGEPGAEQLLPTRDALISSALGPRGVAAAVLGASDGAGEAHQDAPIELPARGLPALLLALGDAHATGVLRLEHERVEREIALVRGVPVAGRSSALGERLGTLALAAGRVDAPTLRRSLERARELDMRLGHALLDDGALAGDELHRLLAAQLQLWLTTACAEEPLRAHFSPQPALAGEHALLPTEPMCAVLAAVHDQPKAEREAAFAALAGLPVQTGRPSPTVDRWLRALGIDVATSVDGASSYGAMLDALAVDADGTGAVDAEALALALTWAGRIAPSGNLPEAASAFAPHRPTLPTLEGAVAIADDELSRGLDARLFPSPGTPQAMARALKGAEAEAELGTAEQLALYLTIKGERDPRRVLGVAQNASHTEIRQAYHARLDALDALFGDGDGQAACMKLELRERIGRARSRILPAEPEPLPSLPPEPVPMPLSAPPEIVSLPPAPAGPLSKPPPLPNRPPTPEVAARQASEPPRLPGPARAAGPPALPPVHVSASEPEPEPGPELVPEAAPEPVAAPAKERFLSKEELEETDAILEQGNWQALIETLDARDQKPQELPPPLRLLYAIALREVMAGESAKRPGLSPEKLGMAAVGELMQAPRKSAAVRVVTRRVLRRRPLQWQKPPSRGISLIVTAIALAIGVGGGLIFSGEIFELFWK